MLVLDVFFLLGWSSIHAACLSILESLKPLLMEASDKEAVMAVMEHPLSELLWLDDVDFTKIVKRRVASCTAATEK